jgi:hypothetical protein
MQKLDIVQVLMEKGSTGIYLCDHSYRDWRNRTDRIILLRSEDQVRRLYWHPRLELLPHGPILQKLLLDELKKKEVK